MGERLFLGMDTCTRWLNLALMGNGGEVLAQFHEEVPTHTTRLVPALGDLFLRTGRSKSDLAAIGVVLGPGSFTGLRVGLAAAEGLAAALGVTTYGLDSLSALALCSGGSGEGMAVLDARRRRVYARRFRKEGGQTVALDAAADLDPAERIHFAGCEWAIGDGVGLVHAWPASCLLEPEVPNLAVPAAAHARGLFASGHAGTALAPLYVRGADVRAPGGG